MTQVLDIYVARHCFGTAEAIRLAGNVRQKLPHIQVNVTMIEDIPATEEIGVPATPAYFIGGRLVFLGNPSLDELAARIASNNSTEGRDDG